MVILVEVGHHRCKLVRRAEGEQFSALATIHLQDIELEQELLLCLAVGIFLLFPRSLIGEHGNEIGDHLIVRGPKEAINIFSFEQGLRCLHIDDMQCAERPCPKRLHALNVTDHAAVS